MLDFSLKEVLGLFRLAVSLWFLMKCRLLLLRVMYIVSCFSLTGFKILCFWIFAVDYDVSKVWISLIYASLSLLSFFDV